MKVSIWLPVQEIIPRQMNHSAHNTSECNHYHIRKLKQSEPSKKSKVSNPFLKTEYC